MNKEQEQKLFDDALHDIVKDAERLAEKVGKLVYKMLVNYGKSMKIDYYNEEGNIHSIKLDYDIRDYDQLPLIYEYKIDEISNNMRDEQQVSELINIQDISIDDLIAIAYKVLNKVYE